MVSAVRDASTLQCQQQLPGTDSHHTDMISWTESLIPSQHLAKLPQTVLNTNNKDSGLQHLF